MIPPEAVARFRPIRTAAVQVPGTQTLGTQTQTAAVQVPGTRTQVAVRTQVAGTETLGAWGGDGGVGG